MSPGPERRYRRLLRAYPADHRAAHGEEMLGVLLDAAGQRARPGLADSFDLVRGGLLVRARRAGAGGWSDALAAVSLVATVLMCAVVPSALLALLWWGALWALPMLVWPLVLAAALLGRRRAAAAGALLGAAVLRVMRGPAATCPGSARPGPCSERQPVWRRHVRRVRVAGCRCWGGSAAPACSPASSRWAPSSRSPPRTAPRCSPASPAR